MACGGTKAAVQWHNNGTLCRGDGEWQFRVLASQRERKREREREIITLPSPTRRFVLRRVRRLSTGAKINPTVDGVLMAREGGRFTVVSPSVSLIGVGGAVFEMAFGDTTSETEIRRRRIDHRSHMLPIEQQQGSQPESGGERKGHRTDGQRAGKQTRANKHNFPSARSTDGWTDGVTSCRPWPTKEAGRQLVGAVAFAAHMAAAAAKAAAPAFVQIVQRRRRIDIPFFRPRLSEERECHARAGCFWKEVGREGGRKVRAD